MRLHASQGMRGKVIDLDTGLPVPKVIWLDVDTGELEAFQLDAKGNTIPDLNGNLATFKAKGRFKLIPKVVPTATPLLGAPQCVKCSSKLTLPGEELCPTCKAKDRGQKHKMQVTELDVLTPHKCEKCSLQANWAVADEVGVTPQVNSNTIQRRQVVDKETGRTSTILMVVPTGKPGKTFYEQGVTVGRRFYCNKHYALPRLVDAKGEIITELETGARPQ